LNAFKRNSILGCNLHGLLLDCREVVEAHGTIHVPKGTNELVQPVVIIKGCILQTEKDAFVHVLVCIPLIFFIFYSFFFFLRMNLQWHHGLPMLPTSFPFEHSVQNVCFLSGEDAAQIHNLISTHYSVFVFCENVLLSYTQNFMLLFRLLHASAPSSENSKNLLNLMDWYIVCSVHWLHMWEQISTHAFLHIHTCSGVKTYTFTMLFSIH
jgi:hypothetical protein